jgi:hypothetical protein
VKPPLAKKKWESRELPHPLKNNCRKLLILMIQTYEKKEIEESFLGEFLLKTSNDYEA